MIKFASENDTPSLKRIWNACFDDPQEYIDSYYANCGNTARTLVLCENDGSVSSMLDMINIQIRSAGQIYDGFYIYAAATLPQYRGKGYMHQLIEYACKTGNNEGMSAALLIPQTDNLVEFYLKQGFDNQISNEINEYQSKSAASIISALSEKEFVQMKTEYENSLGHCVLHSPGLCALIYKQAKVSGGFVVKIETSGNESYAIYFEEKKHLYIQEISSPNAHLENDISALCDFCYVKKAKVTRPGNKNLYGLARTLNKHEINWHDLYMNTMLD